MFVTRTPHKDGMTQLHCTDSISLQMLSHLSSERNIKAVLQPVEANSQVLICKLFRVNLKLTFSQVLLLSSLASDLEKTLGHFRNEEL